MAIKLCVSYYIHLAVLEEAAAMDGTCPLELLADCSGIAWGGSAYQMVADLSHFKVGCAPEYRPASSPVGGGRKSQLT